MSRILVVEDEQDLASLLVYNLQQAGHQTEVAASGAAAVARAAAFRPTLILLDLMLPDISGLEVLRMIRSHPDLPKCAVVMVTAKGSETERIAGFELGADDYVVKPFSVRELMLRVEAVLRRLEKEDRSGPTLSIGPVHLDPARHEVLVSGVAIVLTALEFRLLKALLERPGRIQTREALLQDVWGISVEIETRTVDTHIKRLRQKLGEAGDLIETVRGVGYRLAEAQGSSK
jgi:two-component system, OmpR family, phosphate regulon response regulator PhoB